MPPFGWFWIYLPLFLFGRKEKAAQKEKSNGIMGIAVQAILPV
jgi:hypothetical protein